MREEAGRRPRFDLGGWVGGNAIRQENTGRRAGLGGMRARDTGWGMLGLKLEGKAVILLGCVDSESLAGQPSLCPQAPN